MQSLTLKPAAPKSSTLKSLLAHSRAAGPYLAILLLPGGSVIALLMWLYRCRR